MTTPTAETTPRKRVLLLLSPLTYRAEAFLTAAERLGLDVAKGVDMPRTLADYWHAPLGLDFSRPDEAARQVVALADEAPFDAIISVDDSASILAAEASALLGLPHNSPEAAVAARDKGRMRDLLRAGGAPVPGYRCFPLTADPAEVAAQVAYPCVVKPLLLSGSRGVIRADDPAEFAAAFARTRALLLKEGVDPERAEVLVEDFIPGFEVALEGLLTDGELHVLALFDKPDPLDGPFFEETIYVTPSRLPAETQAAIAEATTQAARALGLRTGPVHAELRVNDRGPWLVEIAGRSIGGLCSTILEFGSGMSLEELILRHAVGLPIASFDRRGAATGVMMIPIPGAGILTGVSGVAEAEATPHVTGVEISARIGHPITPLPEGASYLGFIFARADDPATVEAALREAHARLHFAIKPDIPILNPTFVPLASQGR
ncbi:MAG TPA: ATP-grasp domain-containing protein [Thermomicrobiales bacterium]|nr:ATP-grasp domain-containing protein [Thermomicrobiales bacterium]